MMKNLHPLILTELGLTASLHDLVNHWQHCTPALKIHLVYFTQVDDIPVKIAIQIFRIIQEAITNTVRHAQARHLAIRLEVIVLPSPTLILQIEDDGIGCDTASLSLGFGLLGIKARVKSLAGAFSLESAKNQGGKINIRLPVVDSK